MTEISNSLMFSEIIFGWWHTGSTFI